MSFSNEDPPIHNPQRKRCCDCNGTHAACVQDWEILVQLVAPLLKATVTTGTCNQQHSFSQSTPLQQPSLQQLQPYAQPIHSHQLLKLPLEKKRFSRFKYNH